MKMKRCAMKSGMIALALVGALGFLEEDASAAPWSRVSAAECQADTLNNPNNGLGYDGEDAAWRNYGSGGFVDCPIPYNSSFQVVRWNGTSWINNLDSIHADIIEGTGGNHVFMQICAEHYQGYGEDCEDDYGVTQPTSSGFGWGEIGLTHTGGYLNFLANYPYDYPFAAVYLPVYTSPTPSEVVGIFVSYLQ